MTLNLMLIGCGPHARRIYIPMLRRLRRQYGAELKLVVELESEQQQTVKCIEKSVENTPAYLWAPPFARARSMPMAFREKLDAMVAEHKIDAVIISTAPLMHTQYALWAASHGLHVLMDKPIVTRRNTAVSIAQAKKLWEDYELILAARRANKAFIVNAERRYHPGFQFVLKEVLQMAREFHIPITNMQSSYSDGQWRLPNEILTQEYRSYKIGNGTVSHSGYHSIDVLAHMAGRSFAAASKTFDEVGTFASFVRPQGLVYQHLKADYQHALNGEYNKLQSFSDAELSARYARECLGEVDASGLITLFSGGEPVSQLSMNLMHNSVSRRHWAVPNADLYKGNGRLQHESHFIQQGPYQAIQIHSYQARDQHDDLTDEDYELGGMNHFEIRIFRNEQLAGGEALRVITSRDIIAREGMDVSRHVSDQAKQRALEELVQIARGDMPVKASLSDISSHALGALIMSQTYQSAIARREIICPSTFDLRVG